MNVQWTKMQVKQIHFPQIITFGSIDHRRKEDLICIIYNRKQLVWTGAEGLSSMYDREGTAGMVLNMGKVYAIETGFSIHERKCYVCIAHLDPKAS